MEIMNYKNEYGIMLDRNSLIEFPYLTVRWMIQV
jgi:hypothetical protein